jgi:hypothetical protein
MIGPLVLTIPMVAILGYGILELKRSRPIGIAISLLTIAALAFLWFPALATSIAGALGLGNGDDLVMVAWVGLVTLILLNLHLRLRQQTQMVTALTRQIAIAGRQGQQDLTGPTVFRG